MDAGDGLSEDSEDCRIPGEGSGQLHAVERRIRRHAMEHELPGVGVFTLVAFQRNVAQMPANEAKEHDDQKQQCVRPRA